MEPAIKASKSEIRFTDMSFKSSIMVMQRYKRKVNFKTDSIVWNKNIYRCQNKKKLI